MPPHNQDPPLAVCARTPLQRMRSDVVHHLAVISRSKKILVVTGAGISASCGIPTFRGDGQFYDTVASEFGLPDGHSVMDIRFFRLVSPLSCKPRAVSASARGPPGCTLFPSPGRLTISIPLVLTLPPGLSNRDREDPRPFYRVASRLYPSGHSPSPTHGFIKSLENAGVLLRDYTQNIDTLER
jgi:NAD-dependent histone deacetylase SIR2